MSTPYTPTLRWTYDDFHAWHEWIQDTFEVRLFYTFVMPLPHLPQMEPKLICTVYTDVDDGGEGGLLTRVEHTPRQALGVYFWNELAPLHGKVMQELQALWSARFSPV